MGIDFLRHHNFTVQAGTDSLLDESANLVVRAHLSNARSHCISLVSSANSDRYSELLQKYVDITQPHNVYGPPKHSIEMPIHTTGEPVYERARGVAPHYHHKAKQQLEELERSGIIYRGSSSYASPIMIVPKKGTDELRIVIDYRRLNAQTVKNRYPIPFLRDFTNVGNTGKAIPYKCRRALVTLPP